MDSIDILSVCDKLNLDLSPSSGNRYTASCHLHTGDNTPSFTVYVATSSFYCFGCSAGGNTTTLIQETLGFTWTQAQEWLRANFGIGYKVADVISDDEIKSLTGKRRQQPKPVQTTPDDIMYWHSLLMSSGRAEYFTLRGLDIKSVRKYKFGWNGSRYVLPVWKDGKVLTYLQRASRPDQQPKYLLQRGKSSYLWGVAEAKQNETVILFAGILDAALAQQDSLAAVSTLTGTRSSLPVEWPTLWFPQTKNLILCFDKKESGYSARFAAQWERAKGYKTSYIIHWPMGYQDDYCDNREQGGMTSTGFLKMLRTQVDNNFILDTLLTG